MLKTIFFPGWAMPPDARLARRLLPEKLSPLDTRDYGFFVGGDSGEFNFSDANAEIAKFANDGHEAAVGYSLGSQFALRMALAPGAEKLKMLAIISGFAKFAESHDSPHGQKPDGIKAMLSEMGRHPARTLREFYRSIFGHLKSAIDSNCLIPNPTAMINGLRYLLDCDLSKEVGRIRVPTLIITGEDDTLVKSSLSRRLSEMIPGSAFVSIPDAGHSLPFVNTERIREIIHDFMREKNIL